MLYCKVHGKEREYSYAKSKENVHLITCIDQMPSNTRLIAEFVARFFTPDIPRFR